MRLSFTPLILRRITLAMSAFLIFTALYFVSSQLLGLKTADSAATDNVSGWGWAGNVSSWISLNNCNPICAGADYGLKVEAATGNLSGYAWSDNFGWISFNRAVTNNPPGAPFNGGAGPIARVDFSNGNVTGWARALAGCQDTAGVPAVTCASTAAGADAGGWDGWIKLSDINHYTFFDAATGKLSGFAWDGSDTIGWIDFGVVPAPVITFTASPTSVVSGGNSTLTWSATNAVSCNASDAWTGSKATTLTSEIVGGILPPKTYTLTCTGPAGLTAVRSVTVGLAAAAPSGTLTVSTCDIPFNGTSCSSAATWSSSNFVGTPSVKQGGLEFSAAPAGGPVSRTVNFGNNTFTLVDTGSGVVRTQSINIACLTGSTWTSGSCVPNIPAPTVAPDITISANPALIRSGNTSIVKVEVDSTYKVTCTIKGANNTDDIINHPGAAGTIPYSIPTKTLTSTQVVSIDCVYTDYPGLTTSDEERIKVIPIVQEI